MGTLRSILPAPDRFLSGLVIPVLVLSGGWLLVSSRVQAGRVQRVNEVVIRYLNSTEQRNMLRRVLIKLESLSARF